MNDILRDYINKCAMVYLDDIVIFSKTEGENIENLLAVVRKLENEDKSESGRPSILYFSHVTGILKRLQVAAILQWSSCLTIFDVRSFLMTMGSTSRRGIFCDWRRRLL